jgi:hypothetical protein
MGLARPSSPLASRRDFNPTRSALRFSFDSPRRAACDHTTILSWGFAPLQGIPLTARRMASRPRPLPWGSFPYSAINTGSPLDPGLPHPVRSDHEVLHPHAGFLLPAPCGFVSPRWRPWDSALQGFSLPRSRPRLLGEELALLTFAPFAPTVMTRRSRAPPTRAASIAPRPFRAFRALSPPGVRTLRVVV